VTPSPAHELAPQACNVSWQVSSSATLGVGSTFVGSILALTAITVNTNAVKQRPAAD